MQGNLETSILYPLTGTAWQYSTVQSHMDETNFHFQNPLCGDDNTLHVQSDIIPCNYLHSQIPNSASFLCRSDLPIFPCWPTQSQTSWMLKLSCIFKQVLFSFMNVFFKLLDILFSITQIFKILETILAIYHVETYIS